MKNLFQKSVVTVALSLLFALNVNAVTIPHKISIIPTTVFSDSTKLDSAYKNAIKEFKNSSRAEKKAWAKDAKKTIAEYKAKKKAGDDVSSNDVLMAILCLIPPLAVYIHEGKVINTKFCIALVLTLLFWIPGIIYALLVVFGDL